LLELRNEGKLIGGVFIQRIECVEPGLIIGLVVTNNSSVVWAINEVLESVGADFTGDLSERLIHSGPKAIKGDLLLVLVDLRGPEVDTLIVHPVWVDNVISISFVDKIASWVAAEHCRLNKSISVSSSLISRIISPIIHFNSRVYVSNESDIERTKGVLDSVDIGYLGIVKSEVLGAIP
jgi:hypothetical protein